MSLRESPLDQFLAFLYMLCRFYSRDTGFVSPLMQMTPRCIRKQAASLAIAACTVTGGMETLMCLSSLSAERPHEIKNNISFKPVSALAFHNDWLI